MGVVFVDISFCRLTEYLLLSQSRIKEGKKITNTADRKMTRLDEAYQKAAKRILDQMFPDEEDMELEYQFLAAKIFVAKTCEAIIRLWMTNGWNWQKIMYSSYCRPCRKKIPCIKKN